MTLESRHFGSRPRPSTQPWLQRLSLPVWYGLQFGVGFGAAIGTHTSTSLGLLAALLATFSSIITLSVAYHSHLSTALRTQSGNVLAVVGISGFILLLLLQGLLLALFYLLFFAHLALNLISEHRRHIHYGVLTGFAGILAGAGQAESGYYLLVLAAYSLVVCFCLGASWVLIPTQKSSKIPPVDRTRTHHLTSEQAAFLVHVDANVPPVESTTKTSNGGSRSGQLLAPMLVLIIGSLCYLLIPRLPAANVGTEFGHQTGPNGQIYDNDDWQEEAQRSKPDSSFIINEQELGPETLEQAALDSDDSPSASNNPDPNGFDSEPSNRDSESFQYAGFNDQFSLNDIQSGTLQNPNPHRGSNRIVALMQAPYGTYLRVRTFDVFDGTRWSQSTTDYTKRTLDTSGYIALNKGANNRLNADNTTEFRHSLIIKQTLQPWLPLAGIPSELWLPAKILAIDHWKQPLLPSPIRAGTRYTATSHIHQRQHRLIGYGPEPEDRDLELPPRFDRRITRLTLQTTQGLKTSLQQAEAIEEHLRTNYQYSFDSIFESQGQTPLSTFLFDNKAGHCEYFASAMAMMLRSIGIPSRLVTGFSATNQNPLTGYFEIRTLDGHAWVEAWVDNQWLTFEPTAFYTLPEGQRQTTMLSREKIQSYVSERQRYSDATSSRDMLDWRALPEHLMDILYFLIIVPLSYIALLIQHAWPLLLIAALFVWGGWVLRHYWLPPLKAKWIRRQLARYQPDSADDALIHGLSCLYQLATLAGYPRHPGELIEHWAERITPVINTPHELEQLVSTVNDHWYRTDRPLLEIDHVQALILALAMPLTDAVATPEKPSLGQIVVLLKQEIAALK